MFEHEFNVNIHIKSVSKCLSQVQKLNLQIRDKASIDVLLGL